ncbi:MAG: haloacid dehalogenase [Pseudomonadota bacterium]
MAPIAFGGSVGRWPAFPDSAEALGYLKQHFKLVILSNVDRTSFGRSNAKLGVDFDLVLTAQDIGSYKPADAISTTCSKSWASSVSRRTGSCMSRRACSTTSCRRRRWPAHRLGQPAQGPRRRRRHAARHRDALPDLEVASMAELVERHRAEG